MVLYPTTWWPFSPWRLHLASFALFHLSLGLRGWSGPARPTRQVHGRVFRAYLALLWLAIRAQVVHLNPSAPCEVIHKVRAPHLQFSAFQGREVALSGASRGSVPAAGHAGAARGLVLRPSGVGRPGGREDLELDALGSTQLLGPPVIEPPLARRGPNARERERERERDTHTILHHAAQESQIVRWADQPEQGDPEVIIFHIRHHVSPVSNHYVCHHLSPFVTFAQLTLFVTICYRAEER